jgi:hypothetical protein
MRRFWPPDAAVPCSLSRFLHALLSPHPRFPLMAVCSILQYHTDMNDRFLTTSPHHSLP